MSDTLSAILSGTRRSSGKPALYIGITGGAPRTAPARFGLSGIDRVDIVRAELRAIAVRHDDDLAVATLSIADARASSQHARITRVGARWVIEDLGSKNGTWVDGELVTRRALEDGDAIVVGHTAVVFRERGGEVPDLEGVQPTVIPGLVTLSEALLEQLARLSAVADSRTIIEIAGATGTGKELVARGVHTLSKRAGAFVAINCGALPQTLLESELFGHRRGAFTGAMEDRPGVFRAANGGTLFLDEIAELPLASQAALLRVLQEGEVMPVGADRPIPIDVRVVTATHKDLDAEVAAGRFRADLRSRLLGVSIEIPPLGARPEDLGPLVATFLDRNGARPDLTFSLDAVVALYAHDWPLNVRELERAMAAAVGIGGTCIELDHLPKQIRAARVDSASASLSPEDRALRETVVAAMREHSGNIAAVARALAKDPTQVRRWIKRFGIER